MTAACAATVETANAVQDVLSYKQPVKEDVDGKPRRRIEHGKPRFAVAPQQNHKSRADDLKERAERDDKGIIFSIFQDLSRRPQQAQEG